MRKIGFLGLLMGILLATGSPASAQFRDLVDLDRFNTRLAGRVVDHTSNHGADRRIFSAILGQPRDLYVYLPPGYSPSRAYPLIVYLHMAFIDEHALIGFHQLRAIDDLICSGAIPPLVVACPDGTLKGENRPRDRHSLFINGANGRFGDHLMGEILPFLERTYSLRPDRQARALLGTSAGGFGAMNLALRRRDAFSAVASLAGPLNLRYTNVQDDYFADFDPATFRWGTRYDPDAVIGKFLGGLSRSKASKYIEPVFGVPPGVEARIAQDNPADLLTSTRLQPGELAIYVGYPGRDNFNFDAQAESFAWLAASRGVSVTTVRDPNGTHSLRYFRSALPPAYLWLGQHLAPPAEVVIAQPVVARTVNPIPLIQRFTNPVRGDGPSAPSRTR